MDSDPKEACQAQVVGYGLHPGKNKQQQRNSGPNKVENHCSKDLNTEWVLLD